MSKQKETAEDVQEKSFEELEFKVSRKVFKQGYRGKFGNKIILINDIYQDDDGVNKRSELCVVKSLVIGDKGASYQTSHTSPTHLKGLTKYDAYILYLAKVIEVDDKMAVELFEYGKQANRA